MGLQNTHQNIMKTDLIRLMHGTLLHLFSLDKVKEFWETCPLDVCAAYGSFDTFFEKVWDRHAHLSIADAVIIGNAIEPFLIKNGSNLHEFALKAYLEVGHGTVRRKSTILRIWSRFVDTIPLKSDIRRLLIGFFCKIGHLTSKNISVDKVYSDQGNVWNTDILLFTFDKTSVGRAELVADYDIWVPFNIKYSMKGAGLPELEEVRIIADPRSVEQVLNGFPGEKKPSLTNVNFRDYMKEMGLDLRKYKIDTNRTVSLSTSDYMSKVRRRVVLYEGCVYGAPVCLYKLRYKRSEQNRFSLAASATTGIEKEVNTWDALYHKHEQFLARLNPVCRIVFVTSSETIWIDGMYLSKNTPALLLRKFITSYLTAPDKPILRKELLDSTEVVKDRKHPNLESRFKLLESALRKCNAPFTIRKVHRGCFCLIAYCRIDYTEK